MYCLVSGKMGVVCLYFSFVIRYFSLFLKILISDVFVMFFNLLVNILRFFLSIL